MAIDNPVVVFVAETNIEAHVIANLLKDSGIDAHAVEDNSPAGMYSLGTLDQIHRPKVFASPVQFDEVREVIARYQASSQSSEHETPSPCCYFCGAACEPSAARCTSCGQQLVWDDGEQTQTDESAGGGLPAKATSLDGLRNLKRLVAIVVLTPIALYLGFVLVAVAMSFFQ